jgi:hypothetical protein
VIDITIAKQTTTPKIIKSIFFINFFIFLQRLVFFRLQKYIFFIKLAKLAQEKPPMLQLLIAQAGAT